VLGDILVEGYPKAIDKIFGVKLSKADRRSTLVQMRKNGQEALNALSDGLTQYSQTVHSGPIIEIVQHLPKEELAAMAESLVSLTSFKRHVTKQAETVGGPVDVAVISRGDGLVWIKRKQYFHGDLNPHFLANYYNGVGSCKRVGEINEKAGSA